MTAQPGARVLVGFAESLAAIESAWNLLDHGYDVHAFTREGASPALARDPRVVLHRVTPPELDHAATCGQVGRMATHLGCDVVMPFDDVAVDVADHVRQETGLPVAGPTGSNALLALDKQRQIEVARTAGLLVPVTTVLQPRQPLPDLDEPGPWIAKSALAVTVSDGRVGKGASSVAHNREALALLMVGRTDPVLVQPILLGTGAGVFGHARRGEVMNLSAHRRLRMMNPAGSGSSACRSVDVAPQLEDAARRFIGHAGWDGLFMIELLTDGDGRHWFMELNGRAWGSMALATRRGLDYPAWAVAAALDPAFCPSPVSVGPHVVVRHVGRELLHLAFVARGRRQLHQARRDGAPVDPLLETFPSLPGAARSVLAWHPGDRFYNARRGRAAVLWEDTMGTLRSVTSRRVRT